MRLELDEYAYLNSPIHRWQPKSKLVGLIVLIFAFAFVRDWRLLPVILGITALLYLTSRLPFSFLCQRLRYPGFFLLGVVLLLPFLSGETVIWQWGFLSMRQEGVMAMLLIASRFLSIITTGFILVGTTPFLELIRAMRSLGLPSILADMTLLAYRYLHDIAANLATMQRSMRLRGFGSQPRSGNLIQDNLQVLNRFASLVATLLLRTYEQSERVYKAMRLRGYGMQSQRQSPAHVLTTGWGDRSSVAALALLLLVAISLVFAQSQLSSSPSL